MYPKGEADVTEAESISMPSTANQSRRLNDDDYVVMPRETTLNESREMSTKNNGFWPSMVNDNIIIIENPTDISAEKCAAKRRVQSSSSGGGGGRAGATVRSLSDAELPDPETVRKAKDVFEALVQKQRENNSEKLFPQSNRDTSPVDGTDSPVDRVVTLRGRAWCNGGSLISGNGYHRHVACDSAIHSHIRNVTPPPSPSQPTVTAPKHPPYQRSCSELDQFFQHQDQSEVDAEEIWERYVSQDRGSPVSPEVIAKIRQRGTCVKYYGAEAQTVSDFNDWDYSNGYDSNDDIYNVVGDHNGYLFDYSLLRHHESHYHKPKIIGAIPKSTSSCASSTSTFDDSENSCSSGPTSPYSWLNLGGALERLRAVFGGEENEGFRLGSGSSSLDTTGYKKIIKPRNDDDANTHHHNHQSNLRYHGIWRRNPCWPGSYYVIYDFTVPKDSPSNSNDLEDYSNN